jgi:hypothetical protein
VKKLAFGGLNIQKMGWAVKKNQPQDMTVPPHNSEHQLGKKKDADDYQFKSCILGQKARLLTSGRKSVWNYLNIIGVFWVFKSERFVRLATIRPFQNAAI